MNAVIESLHCYPVKSGRALDLDTATLGARGFPYDREWMLTDPGGRFLTQRELPALARLEARASLSPGGSADTNAAILHLSFDGDNLDVPPPPANASRPVCIWSHACEALDCGDTAAEWLSAHLARTLRLVRTSPQHRRYSDQRWTGPLQADNAFNDGFPLLVANAASLRTLNAQLPRPLPMNRFRPNIVIDGIDAWAEDHIDEIRVGGVRLKLVKPCTRCVITTTDQARGERTGEEPLQLLRRLRHDRALGGVTFAWNAIILEGVEQSLHVGEPFAARWKAGGT
jgi:uncharacterized protein YcbX